MGRNYENFKGENHPSFVHGFANHTGKRRTLYNSWQNMKQRCLNPNHPKYHRYGGRGIKIHQAWLKFDSFMKWALDANYQDGLSLDRIDNEGDYKPSNCRWITISANSKKKSTTKLEDEICAHIRKKYSQGSSGKDLAIEYEVCEGTIWFIVKNLTHKVENENYNI